MSHAIRVDCPDTRVRHHLESWLAEGGLAVPIPLHIDVRLAEVTPAQDHVPVVFRQPGVSFRLLPPDERLSISWDTFPALAELQPGSPCASVTLSPKAIENLEESTRTFFLAVLIFLLRRAGWHHVHGATAVDPAGRGWLFAGDSGSGKSTTVAMVSSRGWAVGTDDIAFLAPSADRVEVRGFRSRIALRSGGRDLVAQVGGLPLPERDKVGYWPSELGGAWVPVVEPDIVLFTSVGGDHTRVEAIGPGQKLAQLVRWSAWVVVEPHLADEHLGLLTRLAGQSRAYQVALGRDLFRHPDLLSDLVP